MFNIKHSFWPWGRQRFLSTEEVWNIKRMLTWNPSKLKLYTSKVALKNKEAKHRVGENIRKMHFWKISEYMSRIYKELLYSVICKTSPGQN